MQLKFNSISIIFLFISLLLFTSRAKSQSYGLEFKGYDVTPDKRTELDLTPDDFMEFQNEFEIAFDYKAIRLSPDSNVGFFGYVFRIINNDDTNIDLISTPTPQIGLNLVLGKSNIIIPIKYPDNAINNWIKIRTKFILNEDRLIFYTPDTFYVHENIGLKKSEAFKIIFGANDYEQFKSTDVPSMVIKDIQIFENGKRRYYWPLNEKDGLTATDKIKGKKAKLINPSWLRLNHQNWLKVGEFESKGVVKVATDDKSGNFYLFGEKELIIFSPGNGNIQKIEHAAQPPFFRKESRMIFNNNDNHIYCYIVNEGPCYKINPTNGKWTKLISPGNMAPNYRHHNSYFHKKTNQIYIFGGYGFHKYSNSIIKIDLEAKEWKKMSSNDAIFYPRYLAGLGELSDTVYILGGYGSYSGNQLINPQSYYDLFGYSIKDNNLFKKFEIPQLIDNMIISNSMWIDKKTRNYYALIYSKVVFNGHLQLIKGNLDSPSAELIGDKIPFKFLDARSFSSLSYFPTSNKLYTYTSYSSDSTTHIAIYSVDYPPNASKNDLTNQKNRILKYVVVSIFFLFLLIVAIVMLRRRKKLLKNTIDKKEESNHTLTQESIYPPNIPITYRIILFGGFQVFNKESEDITSKFSPLLKELFLLILLHSLKNDKGISSEKITEILWYEKSEKSARNNRAVNIAKLRSILDEIENCELTKKTGYWKIIFEDLDVKCDYVDFLKLTSSKNNLTKHKVSQLIDITQKGGFLSHANYDWLDEFKASVSDRIIETLVDFGRKADIKSDADFIIQLTDCIFYFDIVNEEAMILKCKAQYCMGRHSHAKATYEKFFKEYMTMYGQEYERTFPDILEINI